MRIFQEDCYDMLMLKTEQLFSNLTRINWLQFPYAETLAQHNVKTCRGRREVKIQGSKQR